jgi:hypothetical protein
MKCDECYHTWCEVATLEDRVKKLVKRMANIKKVEICAGGKTIGTIDVPKPSPMNQERMLLLAILATNVPLIYTKGETASLRLGKNYSKEFKVKKSFAIHGFKGDQLFVTIPATIDTLRGLGFVGKEKREE